MVDAAVSTGDNAGHFTPYDNNTVAAVGGEIVVTYVDSASGAYNYLRNSYDLTADLAVGTFYLMGFKAKVNAGSFTVRLNDGGAIVIDRAVTATELTQLWFNMIAKNASTGLLNPKDMGAGEVISLDDWVLYALTNTYATYKAKAICTVGAALTIAERGTMAGVVLNANLPAGQTTHFLAALLTLGNSNSSSSVQGVYFKNGVPTYALAATAVTYVAGATLQLQQVDATTYRVLYNNVQVGADFTINDATINANIYAGYLGAYGGNGADSFS